MNLEEYRKAMDSLIELCTCVVNDRIPDPEETQKINRDHLYAAAQKHMLTAMAAYALKLAGINDRRFEQDYYKAIRKVAAMEIDKERLFDRMEEEKIWYMPLKGSVLKDLYPSIGLRQMSDFDILFDERYKKEVRNIFRELGYTCKHFGEGNHDVYEKEPVCHFEMHRTLFDASNPVMKKIYEEYMDVKSRLIKDEGREYGCHFDNNDFYIYIIAHEYKHYNGGGTGLRSLLDTYVIWQKWGTELDPDYIAGETKRLGIFEFEQKNRQLALDLFSGKPLTESERKMLDYILMSGTYGNLKNNVEHKINRNGGGRKGKQKYIFRKLFLPMDIIKSYYPFYYKYKIFLPVLFVYRLIKAATFKRKKVMNELRILKKVK